MLAKLISLFRRFSGDQRGNVIIIMAFATIPLVGVLGISVDYSLMLSVKTKLDHAADAAALAGITETKLYITNFTGTSDPTADAISAGQGQAQAQFNSNTGTLPAGTLTLKTNTITAVNQVVTGNIAYSFSMPTVFMQIFGIKNVTVGGKSTTTLTMAGYTNIYVVIDVSESMGIGATVADQQIVYNATGGCAVACHYSGTDTTAHNNGATLRIDVAKNAVIAALNQMQNSGTQGQYQVAIYTMSTKFKNVFAMSSNLSAAITAVNSISMTSSNNDGGTDTTYGLSQLSSVLPAPGNGLTSSSPKGTVMLITDGVQDSDIKVKSGSTYVDGSDSNFTLYSPCSTSVCKYFSAFNIYIEAFNPSNCSPIKTLGYTMMTLNVQYLVPPSNLQSSTPQLNAVFDYIQQYLLTSIPTNMAACATSSSLAYVANTPSEITAAVEQMFAATGALTRISH